MLLLKCPSFPCLLKGSTIADVVDALEGRDDFFVMSHDDDGSLVLAGHLVKDTPHPHPPPPLPPPPGTPPRRAPRAAGQRGGAGRDAYP